MWLKLEDNPKPRKSPRARASSKSRSRHRSSSDGSVTLRSGRNRKNHNEHAAGYPGGRVRAWERDATSPTTGARGDGSGVVLVMVSRGKSRSQRMEMHMFRQKRPPSIPPPRRWFFLTAGVVILLAVSAQRLAAADANAVRKQIEDLSAPNVMTRVFACQSLGKWAPRIRRGCRCPPGCPW